MRVYIEKRGIPTEVIEKLKDPRKALAWSDGLYWRADVQTTEIFIEISDPDAPDSIAALPNAIARLPISRVSLHKKFAGAYRRAGKYTNGMATAFVDHPDQITDRSLATHLVRISGASHQLVVELYFQIREGKIFPSVDWDAEQDEPAPT